MALPPSKWFWHPCSLTTFYMYACTCTCTIDTCIYTLVTCINFVHVLIMTISWVLGNQPARPLLPITCIEVCNQTSLCQTSGLSKKSLRRCEEDTKHHPEQALDGTRKREWLEQVPKATRRRATHCPDGH